MTFPVSLPKLGESIVSATVVQWFKKVGDRVQRDEPLLEVSTDKVNSEIPSPVSGVIQEILAREGEEIEVGAHLVLLATGDAAPVVVPVSKPAPEAACGKSDFLSPAVLKLLQEKGISLAEVDRIPRSGEGGRLTRRDIEAYESSPPTHERIPMSPLRKAIAENMVRSFYEAPHASLVTEVDVTDLMGYIQREKEGYLSREGIKLTITPFVVRAIAQALRSYPLLNSSLEDETIVLKKQVNLGVAVSVDQGVIVPVIRGVEGRSVPDLSKTIAVLADKARSHRLTPDEVQEGTITLTNFGMTGVLMGTPIIRHPEVAIVGLGAITKKVVAMPDDTMAIRQVLYISLTFDHRVLDGLYGCGFLGELKRLLQEKFQ